MTGIANEPASRIPPGIEKPKRFRPTFHYELIACGLRGHELIGMDAAEIRAIDAPVVRDNGGTRVAPLPALRLVAAPDAARQSVSSLSARPRAHRTAPAGEGVARPVRAPAHRGGPCAPFRGARDPGCGGLSVRGEPNYAPRHVSEGAPGP